MTVSQFSRAVAALLIVLLMVPTLEAGTAHRKPEVDRSYNGLKEKLIQYGLTSEFCKPLGTSGWGDSTGGTQLGARAPGYIRLGTDGYELSESPGLTFMNTYDDWQTNNHGSRVNYAPGIPVINFVYSNMTSASALPGYGFNPYDPTAGGQWPRVSGVGCRLQANDDYGWWPTVAPTPGSTVVIAGVTDLAGPLEHHLYSNMPGSQISNTQYDDGMLNTNSRLFWPQVEVRPYMGDTVTHLIGREHQGKHRAGSPDVVEYTIQYFRANTTTMATATWSGPTTIDTTAAHGHLAVSPNGQFVAVVYPDHTPAAFVNNQNLDRDIVYRKSSDAGVSWASKVNITNYSRIPASHSPWLEAEGLFDSDGGYHVIWTARPWPANVYSIPNFFFKDFSASLFHWTDRTGITAKIADREYGVQAQCVLCGMGGYNSFYISDIGLAECNGRLYTTYVGWNDLESGVTDDCCSDNSASDKRFKANGEIYLHVSETLDGLLWDDERNLTNSYTPDCDSAGFGGVCLSDTKVDVAQYGMDINGYGQSLTFPGGEFVDVDPSYTGSYFLNLIYLEDHMPGQAILGGLSGQDFTENDVKWMRIGCIDPVEDPEIEISPPGIHFPEWTSHGTQRNVTVTITNEGLVSLTGTIEFTKISLPGLDWLDVSTTNINVPPGVSNAQDIDVILNKGGIINSPGTVVSLTGRVRFLTNAPAPDDTVIFAINNFLVADTVRGIQWDTVKTSTTVARSPDAAGDHIRLVVSNHGEVGRNGAGGVNMDFLLDGGDCDPFADVYLYDGSLFILRDVNGDQSDFELSHSLYSINFQNPNVFIPLADGPGMTHEGPDAVWESVYTGQFANWDTSIVAERTYYAPRNSADQPSFVVVKTTLYSPDGSAIDHLSIGSVTDWDIPSDVSGANESGILFSGPSVYMFGVDTSSTKCQFNNARLGTEVMLGWYTSSELAGDPNANNTSIWGMYAARNDVDIEPYGTLDPATLWTEINDNIGLTTEPSTSDQHIVHTFVHDYMLASDDTLTFYTAYLTVHEGAETDLAELSDTAKAWYEANLRTGGASECFASGDVDASESFDVGDLSAVAGYIYGSDDPPANLYEADLSGDCIIDTIDIALMECALFGGGGVGACLDVYPVPTCCDVKPVFGGETETELGDATVSTAGDTLKIDNIGSTGEDGVRLYTESPTSMGLGMELSGVDMSQTDAGIQFEIKGQTEETALRSPEEAEATGVGFVGVYNNGSSIQVLADFSLVGDPDVTMKVYQTGSTVGENTVPGGGLIAIGTDAGFGLPSITHASVHATDPLGFVIRLDRRAKFTMTDNTIMYGDELYLYAKNFTRSITELFAVDVTARWLGIIGLATIERDECCRGFTGNVDDDPVDLVDIGDLTALLAYLYTPPNPEPPCLEEANIDGDETGLVDIGDVTSLVSYLYIPPNPIPAVCK
jgi:hypothetical protein